MLMLLLLLLLFGRSLKFQNVQLLLFHGNDGGADNDDGIPVGGKVDVVVSGGGGSNAVVLNVLSPPPVGADGRSRRGVVSSSS